MRLRLPAELTISCANDTLARLQDVSDEARALVLDAADVVRVDTAGLQLLVASRRASLEARCEWTLANPAGILVDNARRLGLGNALGFGREE
ncbi:MAG: STAS domain-containing protein [Myxococcales bacterium]|nr:STAS domain-containing protein [Myxococcales bacterium]